MNVWWITIFILCLLIPLHSILQMISFPVSCLIRELALAVAEATCALLEGKQRTHLKDGNKLDVLFSFARNISTSFTLKRQ